MEIDLVLVCGPKIALVMFLESIHFVFLWVLQTDIVLVCLPKMIWFGVCVEVDFVCMGEVEVDLGDWDYIFFSSGGSRLTCY